MLFASTYQTVRKPAEAIFRDRGSKFIAFAYPVKTEEEIRQALQDLQNLHPSATHHCYAWRLGPDKQAWRVNDDGEPSGSAGKPIYSQIQSNDLTNVLIVVVRYFGGSLLGVAGLIHAYKTAAAEVIVAAGTEEKEILYEYEASFGNEDMSQVMRLLKELGAKIEKMNYESQHLILFTVRKDLVDQLEDRMRDLYKVKYKPIRIIA